MPNKLVESHTAKPIKNLNLNYMVFVTQYLIQFTKHGFRIDGARALDAGDREFGSQSSQINDFKIMLVTSLLGARQYYDRTMTGWHSARIM